MAIETNKVITMEKPALPPSISEALTHKRLWNAGDQLKAHAAPEPGDMTKKLTARQQLAADTAQHLARGGKISHVAPGVSGYTQSRHIVIKKIRD